ncbi:hypothetical protein V2G26_008645 [Clonostachys chloroleuca]
MANIRYSLVLDRSWELKSWIDRRESSQSSPKLVTLFFHQQDDIPYLILACEEPSYRETRPSKILSIRD